MFHRIGNQVDATNFFNRMQANSSRGLQGREATLRREGDQMVFGTGSGNDQVRIEKKEREGIFALFGGDEYEVTVNGETWTLSEEQLRDARFELGAGNDAIYVDDNVDVPLRVDGGFGHDRIFNQADNVRIEGGSGHDAIHSRGNRVSIHGGAGHDQIFSQGHGGSVHGGFGWDQIGVLGNFNRASGGPGFDRVSTHGFGNQRLDFDFMGPGPSWGTPPPMFFW
jgi:hypothetical protein